MGIFYDEPTPQEQARKLRAVKGRRRAGVRLRQSLWYERSGTPHNRRRPATAAPRQTIKIGGARYGVDPTVAKPQQARREINAELKRLRHEAIKKRRATRQSAEGLWV